MLGFAFKADTGDTRESAAITLIRDFLSERAYVTIYDPKVDEAQIWLDLAEACPATPLETIKKQVTISHSALDACKQKEAVVIATEWKEFKEIDWTTVYSQMSKPAFVFDGRMILDAEALRNIGFTVRVLSHSGPPHACGVCSLFIALTTCCTRRSRSSGAATVCNSSGLQSHRTSRDRRGGLSPSCHRSPGFRALLPLPPLKRCKMGARCQAAARRRPVYCTPSLIPTIIIGLELYDLH